MKESDTATPDAADVPETWDPMAEDPEQDQEVLADAAEVEDDLPTVEADDTSPAAADTDPEAQPDGPAEGEAKDQPEGAPAADAAAPTAGQPAPEKPLQDTKPFVARADGRDIEIPGAVEAGDWIAIPKKSWYENLQPNLADRGAWIEKERGYKQQLEAKSESEVKAQTVLDTFADLLEKGPDAVLAWLKDFETSKGRLEVQMEKAAIQTQLDARKQQDTESEQREATERIKAWAPGALKGAVEDILSQPDFKDAGLDVDTLYDKLWAFGEGMFFTAEEDMPAWGVKKGQIAPRYDLIYKQVQADARMAKQWRERQEQAAKARKDNQAATGKSKAPPAISAKGGPAPGGKKTVPETREEWEESLFSDAG